MREHERWHDFEVAMKKPLLKCDTLKVLTMRGSLKVIHHFGKQCRDSELPACEKTCTAQGTGTGGARAAISQPKAVATPTQTVNPCGPPYPCRSLIGLHIIL